MRSKRRSWRWRAPRPLRSGTTPRWWSRTTAQRSGAPAAGDSTARAEVATAPFVDAVKRVALVAARNAPVRLGFSADGVVLEAGGADDAQASEQLECGWEGSASGEPFQIAFNPQYLLDGLGAVDSDTTTLSFTGPTRPAVLTGKRDADAVGVADYRYLLMPVRLSG